MKKSARNWKKKKKSVLNESKLKNLHGDFSHISKLAQKNHNFSDTQMKKSAKNCQKRKRREN